MKYLFFATFFLFSLVAFSQQDSALMKSRQKTYFITGTSAFYGLSVLGMNELWYKNYERTSFHWIDDSREWLQIDKAGHFITSYIAASAISCGFEATGMNHKKSVLYASGVAMLGISTIEVFDGFSAGWGASGTDLLANSLGVGLFAAQSLIWNEIRIIPKLSWHPTSFAAIRPEVLGRSFPERFLKDYNGHTFWLSLNIKSITGIEHLPAWLCLSAGYGAEGMISGYDNSLITPYFKRSRQYYLSFDVDLMKINTGYKTLDKIIHNLNFIKLPFPALILSSNGLSIHGFYF